MAKITLERINRLPVKQCYYCRNKQMFSNGDIKCLKPDEQVRLSRVSGPGSDDYPSRFDAYLKKCNCANFWNPSIE